MKRGRGYTQAYVPSVLANENRIVVATAVDPTHETKVIPPMMDQAKRVIGRSPEELLVDGNYFTDSIIEDSLTRDVSLLCAESGDPESPKKSQKFHKSHFHYDAESDTYICPAKLRLTLLYQPEAPESPKAQWVYGGASCSDCPLRNQCTTSQNGRKIRRFASDEMKQELRQVMKHPAAKKAYRKRQGMVEPVFAYLRTVQKLNRFHRRGLKAVQVEFNLHILAYNLSRAVSFVLFAIYLAYLHVYAKLQHKSDLATFRI